MELMVHCHFPFVRGCGIGARLGAVLELHLGYHTHYIVRFLEGRPDVFLMPRTVDFLR